jgi:hypothetical protein
MTYQLPTMDQFIEFYLDEPGFAEQAGDETCCICQDALLEGMRAL